MDDELPLVAIDEDVLVNAEHPVSGKGKLPAVTIDEVVLVRAERLINRKGQLPHVAFEEDVSVAPERIVSGKGQIAFVAIGAVVSGGAARLIRGKRHLPFVAINEVVSVKAVAAGPDVDTVLSLTTNASVRRTGDGLRAFANVRHVHDERGVVVSVGEGGGEGLYHCCDVNVI